MVAVGIAVADADAVDPDANGFNMEAVVEGTEVLDKREGNGDGINLFQALLFSWYSCPLLSGQSQHFRSE